MIKTPQYPKMRKTSMFKVYLLTMSALITLFSFSCTVPGNPVDKGLEINSIEVANLSDTSVRVSLQTDEVARATLYYGLTDLSVTVSDTTHRTTHSVTLSGLSPSSTYRYKIVARSITDDLAETQVRNFVTPADTIAPRIMNVRILSVSSSSCAIGWSTSERTTGWIQYGRALDYSDGYVACNDTSTEHIAIITGFYCTQYYFRVGSRDISGNNASSVDSSFITTNLPVVGFIPTTLEARIGDTSTVSLTLSAEDLAGCALMVEYDLDRMILLTVERGPFYTNNRGTNFIWEQIDESRVRIYATWLIDFEETTPIGTSADGFGVVAVLRFRFFDSGTFVIRYSRADNFPNPPDGRPDSELYDIFSTPMSATWDSMQVFVYPR
jgi:hypothetical protein